MSSLAFFGGVKSDHTLSHLTEATGMSPGNMKELSITDEVFIGGVKSDHSRSEVTSKGFHGCVQGVTLGTALRKLKDHEEARGIIEGCSFSVSRPNVPQT